MIRCFVHQLFLSPLKNTKMHIVVPDRGITVVPLDDQWETHISSWRIHFNIFNIHCYSGHPATQTTPIHYNNHPNAKIEISQVFLCQTLHLRIHLIPEFSKTEQPAKTWYQPTVIAEKWNLHHKSNHVKDH